MQLVRASRTPPALPPAALTALEAAVAVVGGLVHGIGTREVHGVRPASWPVLVDSGVCVLRDRRPVVALGIVAATVALRRLADGLIGTGVSLA
jgi:hypothetical protein